MSPARLFASGVAHCHRPRTTTVHPPRRGAVSASPARHRMLCHRHSSRTNVRTSRNRIYAYSLHHAASRSLTPPGQAIGYNKKRVLSFNRFLDSSFDFEKKIEFNIPSVRCDIPCRIKLLLAKILWVSQCLLKQRMMEVVVTTEIIGRAKL